jgi:membrane protease subunit HflC
MKLTMPILALVVAILLVASQSIYTVDQAKYAIKFQLGEIVETNSTAGLYFKVPLMQTIRYYDKRNLTLENADVDRVTTSEDAPRGRLHRAVAHHRRQAVLRRGARQRGRRARPPVAAVRSNLAEEFNKMTMHDAISTGRDRITTETSQGRRRRAPDRRRSRGRSACAGWRSRAT